MDGGTWSSVFDSSGFEESDALNGLLGEAATEGVGVVVVVLVSLATLD